MSALVPTLQRRLANRWVSLAVVASSVLALAARLYGLGHRVFYYDEAWFGYWVLKFLDYGVWEYRPILHGPLFARVNAILFPILGANDFTARLFVAVVGGLLPLVAWLFRERLRDVEVAALAVVLAANPILLYYSRFMRKDLPLAAFMLLALGLVVRAQDTGKSRYLYAAAASLGVAFATKESVLLWMLTWLGAGTLLIDRRFLRARDRHGNVAGAVRELLRRAGRGVLTWTHHVVGAGLVFLAVIVYFYAPRAPGVDGPGLWKALGGEFGMLPAVVYESTVGSFQEAVDYWVQGSIQNHAYLPYLTDTLGTMATGALGVSVLAVVGFLWDRYAGSEPRDLVAFNFYSGVAATLGYPLANNLPVPWSTTHAVVPLAVPAAVGVGVVLRWGRSRAAVSERAFVPKTWRRPQLRSDGGQQDSRTALGSELDAETIATMTRAGLAAAVLAFFAVNAAAVAVETSYQHPHDSPRVDGGNEIVYYAQAPGELRDGIAAVERAAATGGDDVDVLYVGGPVAMDEESVERPPGTGAWHARIPMPWYTEAADADVASVESAGEIGQNPPAVVISTTDAREEVASQLGSEYAATEHRLDEIGDRKLVFFVRE